MCKSNKGIGFQFLFDSKIIINLYHNYIDLCYRIDDYYFFLRFYSDMKKFEELSGFGREDKVTGPKWWKNISCDWKEI